MSFDAERNATEFFVLRLRSHIGKLRLRRFPGDLPGPAKWLDFCDALADTAIGYVPSSSQVRKEDEQRRLLKDANELGNSLYRLLAEMEGVGTDDLPYPVVAPMQRWIESLGFQNVTFFRALSVANYELKRFSLDEYVGIRDPSPSLKKRMRSPGRI